MADPDHLAKIVARIGRPDFGPSVMAALARHAGAGMCSAFALDGAGPTVVLAESVDAARSPFARIASLRYARRYWRRDTDTIYNLGRAHRAILTARRPAGAIRDIDYRLECYGDGDVGERLSVCHAGSAGIIVNAYRDKGSGPFGPEAIEWVEDAAQILIAAVSRHHELSAADGERPVAGPVAALVQSLRRGPGADLSLREAQVLAHALRGDTQAETAAELGIALTSVATYRRRAYAKLGLTARSEIRALLQAV